MTTNNLNIKKRLEDLKLDINRLSDERNKSKAEMCIQLLSEVYKDIPEEIKEATIQYYKTIDQEIVSLEKDLLNLMNNNLFSDEIEKELIEKYSKVDKEVIKNSIKLYKDCYQEYVEFKKEALDLSIKNLLSEKTEKELIKKYSKVSEESIKNQIWSLKKVDNIQEDIVLLMEKNVSDEEIEKELVNKYLEFAEEQELIINLINANKDLYQYKNLDMLKNEIIYLVANNLISEETEKELILNYPHFSKVIIRNEIQFVKNKINKNIEIRTEMLNDIQNLMLNQFSFKKIKDVLMKKYENSSLDEIETLIDLDINRCKQILQFRTELFINIANNLSEKEIEEKLLIKYSELPIEVMREDIKTYKHVTLEITNNLKSDIQALVLKKVTHEEIKEQLKEKYKDYQSEMIDHLINYNIDYFVDIQKLKQKLITIMYDTNLDVDQIKTKLNNEFNHLSTELINLVIEDIKDLIPVFNEDLKLLIVKLDKDFTIDNINYLLVEKYIDFSAEFIKKAIFDYYSKYIEFNLELNNFLLMNYTRGELLTISIEEFINRVNQNFINFSQEVLKELIKKFMNKIKIDEKIRLRTEELAYKNLSLEEIINKISEEYINTDINMEEIKTIIQVYYKETLKLQEMSTDILFSLANKKLRKGELITLLVEKYRKDFSIEYISKICQLYEDETTLTKKISDIFIMVLNKHAELFFDHKISSQELKEKLLNEPEMLQYKDYSKLDELVNFYLNITTNVKKLRAELQLIMGSPANSLSVEELSKKLESKYSELTLEQIQLEIKKIKEIND